MKRFTFFVLIAAGIAAFSFAQTAGEAFLQEGIASWYGPEFDGRPTASGEIFNSGLYTAAHPTLPFGTMLTVTNRQNNRKVTVRVNDRGPFVAARIIDLSRAAAEVLDMLSTGTAPVILERAANAAPVPGAAAAVTSAPLPAPPPPEAAPPPAQASQIPSGVPAPRTETPPAALTPAPAAAQTTEPVLYPAPPAYIKGGIPAAVSVKKWRLQVGAYTVPRNAVDAFDKLKNAGLNPAYEKNGDYYRVVLAGLRAADIPRIAQLLGNAGFREALIREETGN